MLKKCALLKINWESENCVNFLTIKLPYLKYEQEKFYNIFSGLFIVFSK